MIFVLKIIFKKNFKKIIDKLVDKIKFVIVLGFVYVKGWLGESWFLLLKVYLVIIFCLYFIDLGGGVWFEICGVVLEYYF